MVASAGCLSMPLLRHHLAPFSAKLFAINSSRIPPQPKPPSGAKSGLGFAQAILKRAFRLRKADRLKSCGGGKASADRSALNPPTQTQRCRCQYRCRNGSMRRVYCERFFALATALPADLRRLWQNFVHDFRGPLELIDVDHGHKSQEISKIASISTVMFI